MVRVEIRTLKVGAEFKGRCGCLCVKVDNGSLNSVRTLTPCCHMERYLKGLDIISLGCAVSGGASHVRSGKNETVWIGARSHVFIDPLINELSEAFADEEEAQTT